MAVMKEPLFDTSDALCFGEDPEIFMPEGPDHVKITRQAKSICASCPIAKTCLEYAIRNNEWGIWGGTTMKERAVLKKRPKTGVDEYLKVLIETRGKRDLLTLTDENTISV
jgi:WhiB family redox-sensing transcriptional regulator